MKEQENNKRNNHFLTYDGVTKTLAQWSEELGINYGTLKSRINKLGWTTEEALEITKRLRPNFVKDIED
nr:MAG TPA: PVL ORF-50-like family [Caudoviricetes sp.]